MAPQLQVAEVRTVAADDLWLSSSHGWDAVAIHCTWHQDRAAVLTHLERIEAELLPLGARPHWGKLFQADATALAAAYPKLAEFRTLVQRLDPQGTFDNSYLRRVLGS